MDSHDAQRRGIEDIANESRRGNLSRADLLRRAGAAGAALGMPAILGGDAAWASSRAASGVLRIGVAFAPAASNSPFPASGHEAGLRNYNVFNNLFSLIGAGKLVPTLASDATPNKDATVWTIRLKAGVTFHDGSPLTADDVIYSFRYILDKKTKSEGSGDIGMVDAAKMSKIDDLTVRVPLKYAYSILPYQLTNSTPIVKAGTTTWKTLNGTGPFKFVSGNRQKIVLTRNPNYFETGLPRLSGVEIVNIQDTTARLNALKTNQVDTIYPVDATAIPAVQGSKNIKVVVTKTGTYMPIYMQTTKKPFNDNRARDALKFAADRPSLNKLAYGGQGFLGNDMFGYFDPGYPKHIPQREHDPERAKSLWKKAGLTDTKLVFWTADVWPGQVTQGLVYAQQAKQAGIDITVQKVPSDQFFLKAYGVQPFSNDWWSYIPILTNLALGFVPGAPYAQAAAWSTPRVTRLYKAAAAQTNESKRNELTGEIMSLFHTQGPYVVWAFEADPQLYNTRIGGQDPHAIRPLNGNHLQKFFIKG